MVEVTNVHDVWLHALEQLAKTLVDVGRAVPIFESSVVDDVDRDPRIILIALDAESEVGSKRVFLTSEDVNFVSVGEPATERLRVDLGPGIVPHRVAVNDLDDLHKAPAG
jgi:hypothetical protein